MDTKPAYVITKPSFWNTRREIRDAAGGRIGYFTMTGWWWTRAEGEARGRRFRFGTESGWDTRRIYMADMSGQKVAHIAPKNWWGNEYRLTYGNEEYTWKVNGWGTTFTISRGDTEVLRVRHGGYFKPGEIRFDTIDEEDALNLALFGLFQMQVHASNSSAAGAAVSTAS